MITIRREQMQALGAYMREGFVDRMVVYLAGAFPDRCASMGQDAARTLIHRGIEQGKKWGIERERDVQQLITWIVGRGQELDQIAQAQQNVLESPQLSGQAKIALLQFHLTGRLAGEQE